MTSNQHLTALLVTSITTFLLGVIVYFRGRRRVIQIFMLYSLSIATWSLGQALHSIAPNLKICLFWARFSHVGVVFIPTFFLHFVFVFLETIKRKRLFVISAYMISTFFLFFNLFTTLYIPTAIPKFSLRYYIEPGPLYIFSVAFFIISVFYGLYKLFEEYMKSTGAKHNQMKYLCWSSLIGYIGGSANFLLVYNTYIPILNPFSTYAVPLYVGVTTYAIVKYRLMDINIAITRAAIFAVVYGLILGIPIGLMGWGEPWLYGLFGSKWYWIPLILSIILATSGPFVYLHFQRRAENALLKDQRRYQGALRELSMRMTRIRNIDELVKTIGTTIVDAVKTSHVGIYLKDDDYNSYRIKFSYPPKNHTHFKEFLALDHPIVKLLYQHRKPLLSEEAGSSVSKEDLDFSLAIPCFIEDNLLAFIVLGAKPGNQMYTHDDLIVFETLSYSAALSIEDCFFWKEIEDRQRKARLQEMDAFSYSLAHEIDNPMSIIVGNSDLLKMLLQESGLEENKINDLVRYIGYIQESSKRVSAMVKAIYDFGKESTGKYYYLRINDAVESFIQLYTPEFKHNKVFLITEIPKEPIIIYGQKQELISVFINFAKNSIHALQAAKEKKITIKVEKVNADLVRITFSDTGYGIPEDKIPIVFAPFVTTKASSEGRGMGLYFVKRTIDRHKGKVRIESEGVNKGTSVILELPIAKDIKEEDLPKEEESKKSKHKF